MATAGSNVSIDRVLGVVTDTEIRKPAATDQRVEAITDLCGRTTTTIDLVGMLNSVTDQLLADGTQIGKQIITLDSFAIETNADAGWLVTHGRELRAVTWDALGTESISGRDLSGGRVYCNPAALSQTTRFGHRSFQALIRTHLVSYI